MRQRQLARPQADYEAAGRRVDASLLRSRLWLIRSRAEREVDSWAKEWAK